MFDAPRSLIHPRTRVRYLLAVMTWLASVISCARDLHIIPSELGMAVEPARRYRKVASSLFSYCALDDRGAVDCWDRFRDVGSRHILADLPRTALVDVAVGADWACGLQQDGEIECWGHDQAKSGIPPGHFTAIELHASHACALRRDGAIVCWGYDQFGPVERSDPGPFLSITAGDWNCGGLRSGSARCWRGQRQAVTVDKGGTVWKHWYSGPQARMLRQIDEDGRLTLGDGVVRHVPGRYRMGDWEDCSHCAIRTDGKLRCWAARVDRYGYCATRLSRRWTPRGRYVDFDSGYANCAVRDDGALICWENRN
jgi:Regulator of chromosome condensation (RCC1) repeat